MRLWFQRPITQGKILFIMLTYIYIFFFGVAYYDFFFFFGNYGNFDLPTTHYVRIVASRRYQTEEAFVLKFQLSVINFDLICPYLTIDWSLENSNEEKIFIVSAILLFFIYLRFVSCVCIPLYIYINLVRLSLFLKNTDTLLSCIV